MISTFSKIWDFSKGRHKTLIKGLLFSFIKSVFGITQLFAILIAVNVVSGQAAVGSSVITICFLTVLCVAGNYITSYIEQLNTTETGFYMIADKRVSLGNLLRRLPLGFFTNSSSQQVISTLTGTLSAVESASVMVMIGIISGLFNSLALFIFMLFYNLPAGIITGVGMVLYLMVVNRQMKISRKNAPALQKAQTELSDKTLTFLKGIRVIKSFSFEKGDGDLKKAIENSRDENISLTKVSMPSQYLTGIVVKISESLILVSSLYSYMVTESIGLSEAVLLIIFSFMVYASLNQAGSMLAMIGLLDTGLDETEAIEKNRPLEIRQPEKTMTSTEIVFDNVSFSYGDRPVLKNISTTMKAGTLTAIIGPSGSGKSTMCHLIPRFHDVSSGSVSIGGSDIRNMDYDYLMANISMVFQKVYLFEDTVMNNIRFGKPDASFKEVRDAAVRAGCDDFIMKLPEGYDTVLEEGGSSLSGGEKQRISIARAILKDSPIIILDEATSALDGENERYIMDAVNQLIKDKTVIMIAHRLKTVRNADHIIAIDDGCIVQEGTHESLIKEEGVYRDFMNAKKHSAGWQLTNR